MAIRLFEVENRIVKPTEHCYTIGFLKKIMDEYPDSYMKIYAYLFYMSYVGPENPYFNIVDEDLEEKVLRDIEAEFDIEDAVIRYALAECKKMYETPIVRAYNGISGMLEKLATYMSETELSGGRDGNITAVINAAKNFDAIRKSFKGTLKDLEEEQKVTARGKQSLAYDQRK
jgi:hypothetical protein